MTHKFINFNQEKINIKRSSALTGGVGASRDGPSMRWAGLGGRCALPGEARPGQGEAGPGDRQALLGEAGSTASAWGWAGRGRDRAGRSARAAGRGGADDRPALLGGARWGRRARPVGARPR
jgi:hypothetical protein